MPVFQSLVLTDRAATPVNHTLTPDGGKDGVYTVSKKSGVAIGDPTFSISARKASSKRKTRMLLTVPVVQNEIVNGITKPVVVRRGYFDVTVTFEDGSTEQERKDLVGMAMSALDPAKVLVNDTVVKGEGIWG